MDCEEIENWFEYFKSRGLNVFKVMEAAIEVAYCYQPDDFYEERPRMAELLFGKPNIKLFHGKDKVKILESMGKTPEEVAEKALADARGVKKSRHVVRIKLKHNKQVQSSEVEANTGSASKIKCDDVHKLLPLEEDAKKKGKYSDNTSKVEVKNGEGRAYDDEVKVNQNDDKHNLRLLEDVQKKPSSMIHDVKGPSHTPKDAEKTKAYDDQKQVSQRRLETSKRKLELSYRQIQDGRKKVQVIDFKDVPSTTKNVGCRNKIYPKIRVSHGFRRAVF